MIASIAPIAPLIAVPAVQPSEDYAPVNSATNAGRNMDNPDFLTALEQILALKNAGQLAGSGVRSSALTPAISLSQENDGALVDSAVLTHLNSQSLTALSDANAAASITATGKLSPTQLAELVTLQDDAQMLNGGQNVTLATTMMTSNSASTVTLSPQAVEMLNAVNSGASASAVTPAANALTSFQLQQIAGIIAPLVNQPLTQETLTLLRNAVTTAGFNPVQLSLQTLFLSMNYLAELSAASEPDEDGEQRAANEMLTSEFEQEA